MRLGEIIDNYLQTNGMSQRQFAKKCGMSNGYISMLIKNKNTHSSKPIVPSLTALLAISKALGSTLDELLEKADDIQIDLSAAKNMTASVGANSRSGGLMQLTDHEKDLILAYRKNPAMQTAVDKLLGIDASNAGGDVLQDMAAQLSITLPRSNSTIKQK